MSWLSNFIFLVFLLAMGLFPFVAIAQNDREIVAAVLILEAGGERSPGMEAVMEVIQNRAKERKLSNRDIVLQSKQFSCANGKTAREIVELAKPHKRWSEALRIAVGVTSNYTKGANHYFATRIKKPYWAKGEPVVIGGHAFYKI